MNKFKSELASEGFSLSEVNDAIGAVGMNKMAVRDHIAVERVNDGISRGFAREPLDYTTLGAFRPPRRIREHII